MADGKDAGVTQDWWLQLSKKIHGRRCWLRRGHHPYGCVVLAVGTPL